MAYKFQLGEAKLSGSITQTDGTTTLLGLDNSEANITNVGVMEADVLQADSTTLTLKGGNSDVTSMILDGLIVDTHVPIQLSGALKIQFGGTDDTMGINAGNLEISGAADISINAPAGDVDIALHDGTNGLKLGGTLVEASATELNNLASFADAAYNQASHNIVFHDGTSIKRDSNGDFLGAISAEGLEVNSNQLRIKNATDGALTFVGSSTDELSVKLSGSSLSKNADGLSLSDTIPGARTFSDNVTIQGDLTVQGSTTTVDSTTINISSSFTFEGPVDAHQTILDAGTPVADTTVYLPELSAGTYYIPAFEADPAGTSLSVTPAELNLLDGGTSVGSSITIADTDGFIINDGGTMKSIPASDIKDYASAAVALSVASKADGDTLATGMNYFAALSADATVTLPASPSVGDLIYVKANSFSNGAGIIVNRAGSQTIDGQNSILLESNYAAVTLVYVASNDWRIV